MQFANKVAAMTKPVRILVLQTIEIPGLAEMTNQPETGQPVTLVIKGLKDQNRAWAFSKGIFMVFESFGIWFTVCIVSTRKTSWCKLAGNV